MQPEPTANRTLSAETVRSAAAHMIMDLLTPITAGYRVTREMMADALIYAAAERTSLHGVGTLLDGLADDNTLRDHLNAAFPAAEAHELNLRLKTIFLANVPKAIFRRRQELAIDLKDFPYYGKSPELAPWICRGQARDGTTRFLRIATVYVMRNGQRVTLAAMQVSRGMTNAEILSSLLGHLRFRGVKITCLYLDRGFASVSVVRVIQQMRMPAVIACPLWGTETSGVRQYCKGRGSHTVHHLLRSSKHGAQLVTLALARCYSGGKRSPKKARWCAYIVLGHARKPLQVQQAYRRRFGIETSYRVLNQIRPRTTSRNPAIRILLVMIGLLLTNLWVHFKRLAGRRVLPPHGYRSSPLTVFNEQPLRMLRLRAFLRAAIEHRYGLDLHISLPTS